MFTSHDDAFLRMIFEGVTDRRNQTVNSSAKPVEGNCDNEIPNSTGKESSLTTGLALLLAEILVNPTTLLVELT